MGHDEIEQERAGEHGEADAHACDDAGGDKEHAGLKDEGLEVLAGDLPEAALGHLSGDLQPYEVFLRPVERNRFMKPTFSAVSSSVLKKPTMAPTPIPAMST
jgi:hypothetical protein